MDVKFDKFPVNILEQDGTIARKCFNFIYNNFSVFHEGKCIYSSASQGVIESKIINNSLFIVVSDKNALQFMNGTFSLTQISSNIDRIIWSKNLTDPESSIIKNEPDILSLFFKNNEMQRASFVIYNPNIHIEFNKSGLPQYEIFEESDFDEEYDEEFDEDLDEDLDSNQENDNDLNEDNREENELSMVEIAMCIHKMKDGDPDIRHKNKNILLLCQAIYDEFDNSEFEIKDEFKADKDSIVFWSNSKKYKLLISRYNLDFLRYNVFLESYENGQLISYKAPYFEQYLNITWIEVLTHFRRHLIDKK